MCGLLVYQLEEVKQHVDKEMQGEKTAHDAATKKRGVLGRMSRAEMPARVIESFEEFLEKRACNAPSQSFGAAISAISRIICRSDGMDDSMLRLPSGSPALYSAEECNERVDAVCDHVSREHADEIIDAAYNNLTARACEDIVESDACDATRATKLLGPLYGKAARGLSAPVGVRDTWQKMPGRPPYYMNRARRISQVEVPEGWDPDGPREQSLPAPQSESKDEL